MPPCSSLAQRTRQAGGAVRRLGRLTPRGDVIRPDDSSLVATHEFTRVVASLAQRMS
jgi:hypothetical protein